MGPGRTARLLSAGHLQEKKAPEMKFQRHLQMIVIVSLSLIALAVGSQAAQAQTFTVIHNFTSGVDGGLPMAGVAIDAAGNLYGTTFYGGAGRAAGDGSGTVFRLKRSGPNWIFTTLYIF